MRNPVIINLKSWDSNYSNFIYLSHVRKHVNWWWVILFVSNLVNQRRKLTWTQVNSSYGRFICSAPKFQSYLLKSHHWEKIMRKLFCLWWLEFDKSYGLHVFLFTYAKKWINSDAFSIYLNLMVWMTQPIKNMVRWPSQ